MHDFIMIVVAFEKVSLDAAICFIDEMIDMIAYDMLIAEAEARANKLANDRLMNHRKNYSRSNWLHNIKKTAYKKGGYRTAKAKGQKQTHNKNYLIWDLT